MLGTGRIIIDVQGEDDSLTLEYIRKPAVVQRVINSQINEIVGGGRREAIPDDMLPSSTEGWERRDTAPSVGGVHDPYGSERHREHDPQQAYEQDTPPFGVEVQPPTAPGATETRASADRFEIRDRLIELDDLRRRGIISEEEFASKKSELLNRI